MCYYFEAPYGRELNVFATCGVDSRKSSYGGYCFSPPEVNLWTGIMFGGGEKLYLVVEQTNRLFTAKQGVFFTPLFQWTERVIYGTPLDLIIDPGASGGPRVTILK